MEPKVKDAPKTKDALKQLQAEMRQLQAAIASLHRPDQTPALEPEKPGKADWAVHFAVKDSAAKSGGTKAGSYGFSEAQIGRVSDEAAAALGSAVSSPQKIALLRVLLATADGETAGVLGDAASLSTGSLYHHLHDLVHAGLVAQSGRSRYILTDRGRRIFLVFLALASHS